MDVEGRRSVRSAATPTTNEAFWAIVDANWSEDDLSFLVTLWKLFEDRLRSRMPGSEGG